MGKSVPDVTKVALAHGYMGVHNFPLVVAEEACNKSLAMLDEVLPKSTESLRPRLAVRQLRAHALQNMGRTGEALKEYLEIEAHLRTGNHDWPGSATTCLIDSRFTIRDPITQQCADFMVRRLNDVFLALAMRNYAPRT